MVIHIKRDKVAIHSSQSIKDLVDDVAATITLIDLMGEKVKVIHNNISEFTLSSLSSSNCIANIYYTLKFISTLLLKYRKSNTIVFCIFAFLN